MIGRAPHKKTQSALRSHSAPQRRKGCAPVGGRALEHGFRLVLRTPCLRRSYNPSSFSCGATLLVKHVSRSDFPRVESLLIHCGVCAPDTRSKADGSPSPNAGGHLVRGHLARAWGRKQATQEFSLMLEMPSSVIITNVY